jgi:hypothetical protein
MQSMRIWSNEGTKEDFIVIFIVHSLKVELIRMDIF